MNSSPAIDQALACIDSDFLRSLAEPARLDILKLLLANGESDVGTLADQMPQDRSVISRHLAMMHRAGVLEVSKTGRHKFYAVDPEGLLGKAEQVVQAMRQCIAMGCC